MQKKILALAVAGLMSGAAFAQSNVTVYGIVDAGYSNWSGSEAPVAADERKSRSAIDAGNQATSRIGFRGTEDLGGGLSVGFTLEFGLTNDRGDALTAAANTVTPSAARSVAGSTALTDRTQTISLSSKTAGTLVMGRIVNPARALVNALDPFGGGGGVGHSQNIQFQTTWADNVIAYASPKFSGFDVVVGYTNRLGANEQERQKNTFGATADDIKGYVIVPKYAAGPITAGFSYESFNRDGTAAANQDLKLRRWNLAGSYDFGVAKVGVTYGKVKANDITAVTGDVDGKQWMLSGWVPVTANGTIMASYNRAKHDIGAANIKASQWALGYNHAMSKRTNAYVTYASLSTNNDAEGLFSVSRNFSPTNANGELATASLTHGFTRGLNIGLRHNF